MNRPTDPRAAAPAPLPPTGGWGGGGRRAREDARVREKPVRFVGRKNW